MSARQGSFVEGLTAAARDNPLAAALIGGGALWLLIGNEKLKNAASSVAAAAEPMADAGARAGRAASSAFESRADRLSRMQNDTNETWRGINETVRDATSAASEAVSGTAESMRERFDDSVAAARERWDRVGKTLPRKETFTQVQSSLSELFERQPLVLGAVGLAIGATVAGALAKSSAENEWVGELSDSVKEDLKTRAGAVAQSARQASDTIKAEFSDAGAEYVDRLQQAGGDALDAARERIRS